MNGDPMTMPLPLDALILAGGQGTRLRAVLPEGLPKPLAPVRGRPFLWYLLRYLARMGLRRVILATGYRAETFHAQAATWQVPEMTVEFSEEPSPLGTGGAVRHALAWVRTDPLLVLNGDSFCPGDLRALLARHQAVGAALTDMLTAVPDVSRYGAVTLDGAQWVTAFVEKGVRTGPGLINAGIYLLTRQVLDALPAQEVFSLERDVFPAWVGRGLYGHVVTEPFLDIGTPDSYRQAEEFFRGEG